MVDYLLLVLGIILMIAGLIGCVLPVIPGPPISFIGLIVLQLTRFADFELKFMLVLAFVTILVTILDYVVPIWGTKKLGGTRAGLWGAGIGMFVGIFFFPPIGLIIGPFLGAFVAELIKGAEVNQSFRSGLGSLLGFMLSTGLKLITSFVMTYYFVAALF